MYCAGLRIGVGLTEPGKEFVDGVNPIFGDLVFTDRFTPIEEDNGS